jgi:hypothetical protein
MCWLKLVLMAWSKRLIVLALVLISLVVALAALRPPSPVRLAYDDIQVGMSDAEINQITCRRGLSLAAAPSGCRAGNRPDASVPGAAIC